MGTPLNTLEFEAELLLARKSKKTDKYGYIQRGSVHRAAVRSLQQVLSEKGYEISTDGIFGDETDAALREFQKDHNLEVDGILGPKTLAKLRKAKRGRENPADPSIDAITRVVTPGTSRPASYGKGVGDIKALQEGGGSRKGKGSQKKTGETPKGPHGGAIDPVTGKERASSTTGPIGSTKVQKPTKMSWEKGGKEDDPGAAPSNAQFEELHPRAPAGSPAGGKFVAKGDSGEQVQNTQKAINRIYGFPKKDKQDGTGLKEDGEFGDKTDAAVRQYQQEAGLQVDGIVGPKTSASLRRRLRARRAG